MRAVWRTLYAAGVDVVVVAHDHLYERFAPQDADLRFDPVRGMRQFVVGTGGAHLYDPRAIKPNSEVRASEFGVLKLNLRQAGYEWQFVPIEGGGFRDFGTGDCH
jgi:hypothetical protein